MNGLAAVGAAANVGCGNIDGNRFQQIDGCVLQLRDDLRRRCLAVFFGVATADQVRRDDESQRFRANARTVRDDEIAETEERFVFLPDGYVEEGVGANDEEDAVAVAVVGVAEVAYRVDGIVKLRAAEIFAGFGERRNEMRMLGAGEGSHGKTMREWGQVLFEFVRRAAGGDEMDFVKIEAAVGGTSDGEVAVVNWVEGASEQRDTTRVMLGGSAMRLRSGQCAPQEMMVNFLTNF
jgi:hypothetical protein